MFENNLINRLFYKDPNTKINDINLKHSRYKCNGRWCLEDFNNRKSEINNQNLDFEQKTFRKYLNKFTKMA